MSVIVCPLLGVCPCCGHELDLDDLNDSGREMLAKHGPPRCLSCGRERYRVEVSGVVTQLGPGTRVNP